MARVVTTWHCMENHRSWHDCWLEDHSADGDVLCVYPYEVDKSHIASSQQALISSKEKKSSNPCPRSSSTQAYDAAVLFSHVLGGAELGVTAQLRVSKSLPCICFVQVSIKRSPTSLLVIPTSVKVELGGAQNTFFDSKVTFRLFDVRIGCLGSCGRWRLRSRGSRRHGEDGIL